MKRKCKICNEFIQDGRLKVLPDTYVCVKHSNEEKKLGFQIISGKDTYSELSIVNSDTYKDLKKYDRKGFNQNLRFDS